MSPEKLRAFLHEQPPCIIWLLNLISSRNLQALLVY